MNTVIENLNKDVINLKSLFEDFFLNHSEIYYDPQRDSELVLIGRSDYRWKELNNEGKQIQNKLLKEYKEFINLVLVLIKDVSKNMKNDFEKCSSEILSCIEQNQQVWVESTEEVLSKVSEYIDKQMEVVDSLYDPKEDSLIMVPDTNALLSNPDIENWKFEDVTKFNLLLVPAVSSELDRLKVFHNNVNIREKCKKIIRRLNEYRRRGTLTEGVPVIKNKIWVRAIAVEPDFNNTLSWLDIQNNDDRILASFIEIMRLHPNSKIILVTNDLNLQNKAEFARIPWVTSPI